MTTPPSARRGAPLLTLGCVALVCALGTAALHQATMGFRVVSTEDGRRLGIARQPRALPQAMLHMPGPVDFHAALAGDGRIAIVAFVYTRCNAVCSVLGSEFQQLQQAIVARGVQGRVRLISISFDARDTAGMLAAYAAKMGARSDIWRFAGIADTAQRARLLAAFGIVVLPAPYGEFQHNAAFHLVGPDGRLLRIVDLARPALALERALALAPPPRSRP